jgi:DNA-binding response OmpR family regulator
LDRTHISVAQSAIEVPKASRGHILLIAQDVAVAKAVCADLDAAGLQCTFVRTCVHARRVIRARRLDLILLDRMVLVTADAPCWSELRGHRDASIVPILTFSRSDDALVVSARVRAIMQVATRPAPEKLEGHGIVLDRAAQRALYRGHDLRLAAAQFRLLEYFLKNPGRILLETRTSRKLVGL